MARMISLEDHYASSFQGRERRAELGFDVLPPPMGDNMESLGTARIEAMDRGDVALQVVSLIPAAEPPHICQQANDELAHAVKQSNGRLAGFAAVPMGDPSAAGPELRRCVKELGFVGALIPNHAGGRYYDGPDYRPFWKEAQDLDIPVYIHPAAPTDQQSQTLLNGAELPPQASYSLTYFSWGWHADVAVHFLRLWASGLFDPEVCPNLKIVLGHMGEMLPFMLGRADRTFNKVWTKDSVKRSLKEVWNKNIWVTLSGMWDLAPLASLLRCTDVGRIMYSVDWPFESEQEGKLFMKQVKESGLVSEEEWKKIAWRNAETLLRVKRPA